MGGQGKEAGADGEQAICRLAGGVAHDFNNLLSVITGCSLMLLNDLPPGDRRRADAEDILRASERAAALARQLLALSRGQAADRRLVELNAVVAGTERMLQAVSGEQIELRLRLGPVPGWIEADPAQLEQALINLAANARDAIRGAGRLSIETEACVLEDGAARKLGVKPGAYARLSVADTGCGMAAEVLAHIFEPFFTTKGRGRGTGLGLAIVHGMVRRSAGGIRVESELGRGTRVEVFLPLRDRKKAGSQKPEARSRKPFSGPGTSRAARPRARPDPWSGGRRRRRGRPGRIRPDP